MADGDAERRKVLEGIRPEKPATWTGPDGWDTWGALIAQTCNRSPVKGSVAEECKSAKALR